MCKSQRNGLLLFSLLFFIPILTASEHRNHGSDYHITGLLKFLLNIPYRPWQNLQDKKQSNSKKSIEDYRETTDLSALAEQKRSNNFELPSRTIESSIVKNEDLQITHLSSFVRKNRQENGCVCTPNLACGCNCVTTCLVLDFQCEQTCTHVTVYTAEYLQGPYNKTQLSTSVTTYNNNCNDDCFTSDVTTDALAPHVITDAPHLINDPPYGTTGPPHSITDPPYGTTEASHLTNDPPYGTTEAPHLITDPPYGTIGPPHSITDLPSYGTTEAPHVINDPPYGTTGAPHLTNNDNVTINVSTNVSTDATVPIINVTNVETSNDGTNDGTSVGTSNDGTSVGTSNSVTNYVPPVAIVVGGIVAIALAVAIPLGINPPPVECIPSELFVDFTVVEDKIPFNSQPFFEKDFPPDGCGNNSVRMEIGNSNRNLDRNRHSEGNCQPLMRRGNCRSPQDWVTVNPTTLKGICTPRLCGRGRVFVGRDGLCHDIYDPGECQGGRRLYYSPFGDPICDCPIGQYPFPNAEDNCVALFTQGPCRDRSIVGISSQGQLECMPSKCQSTNVRDKSLQLLPAEDGQCYALGTLGPCSPPSLLGYDIFKRQMECVNVQNDTSPYFTSPEEEALIDSIYNQRSPDFDDFRISMVFKSPVGTNDIGQRRQGATTGGIFQFPSSSPETLLNPCRPGARREMNYKCTNPLVPNPRRREPLQAVRPAFQCPPNRNLQATGRCVTDNRSTNCGPSFRFNPVTGQCRSIF